jgi:hypothetical protein
MRSAQNHSSRVSARLKTLKGLMPLLAFSVMTVVVEILVVLYAMSLGVHDQALLQWSFVFPGTSSNVMLVVSPLFHLVPISVVLTLVASWVYLRRKVIVRPIAVQRGKPADIGKRAGGKKGTVSSKLEGRFAPGGRSRFARANVRSALIVLLVFSALLIMISLFTYPRLLYEAVRSMYESNPSLLGFVKGVGASLASIGAVFSSINNAIVVAAPGFRGFVLGLGVAIMPLSSLDDVGKYLVFQNAAAWISAFIVLFYGEYWRKSSRPKRR